MRKILIITFSLLLMVFVSCSQDLTTATDRIVESSKLNLEYQSNGVTYSSFYNNGECYLYLPYGTAETGIQVTSTQSISSVSGATKVDDNTILVTGGSFTVTTSDGDSVSVTVAASTLPSVSISLTSTTLDGLNSGSIDTVYKKNKITVAAAGYSTVSDTAMKITGEDAYEWNLSKKSYEITLSSAKDILGMGSARTWELVASQDDPSLMRNMYANEIAKSMGMDYAISSEYADLWIDGQYLGVYQISEKIEVGANRIDLQDDYGVLVELDNLRGTLADTYVDTDISGSKIVLAGSVAENLEASSSEQEQAFQYIVDRINEFEAALYNGNWDNIYDLIDVDSFIQMYFLLELAEDPNGTLFDLYFYMDEPSDVLHVGFSWNYEVAFGNNTSTVLGGNANSDYLRISYTNNCSTWFEKLLGIEEFQDLLEDYYDDTLSSILNGSLSAFSTWKSLIQTSAEMNFKRWNILGQKALLTDRTFESTFSAEVSYLTDWVSSRISYLDSKY